MSRTVGKRRGQRRIKTRGKYKKRRRNSQKKRNGTNKRTRTKSKWIGGGVVPDKNEVIKEFKEPGAIQIEDMKRIGNDSSNGYVLKVLTPGTSEYDIDRLITVENYTKPYPESTILKIPRNETGQLVVDNLDYEHKVGLYINELMKYYPCFVKTMNFYEIVTKQPIKSYVKNEIYFTKTEKERRLKIIGENIKENTNGLDLSDEGCGNKNDRALQLQYVNGQTLADIIKKLSLEEKYGILLQVYGPLYNLSDNLPEDNDKPNTTGRRKLLEHKDLHQNNILVVTLPDPIKMVYKFDFDVNGEKEIAICTKYIAKIIDYGRCYIPSTDFFYDEMRDILEITIEEEKNKKKQEYKEFLKNCGLKHILYPYPDFNMYNKIDCDICKNNKTVLEDIIVKLKNNKCEKSVFNFVECPTCEDDVFTITIDCTTQNGQKEMEMNLEKLPFGINERLFKDYDDDIGPKDLNKTLSDIPNPPKTQEQTTPPRPPPG